MNRITSSITQAAHTNVSDALRGSVTDTLMANSMIREAATLREFLSKDLTNLRKILDPAQKHKLRALLNHFLSPTIQPTFVTNFASPDVDKDLIHGVSSAQETVQTPFRMIDINTRNMVDAFPLGPEDQYCIVSHSWKGAEIDHAYFLRAKKADREQTTTNATEHNDVDLVVAQCEADLRAIEAKVLAFLPDLGFNSVEELLDQYLKVKRTQQELGRAEGGVTSATAYHKKMQREAEYYPSLVKGFQNTKVVQGIADDAKAKASEAATKALDTLAQKQQTRSEQEAQVALFDQRRRESYIIEDLLCALHRNKSLRKILLSIERTKELFDQRPFSPRGKRYVWLDTCCIDKANINEYTQSMPLMGDWYANADLCLVHLDTSRSDGEWLDEWNYWKSKSGEFLRPNFTQYEDIINHEVEWATRGWTLQELVLSKTTFYVNALFEPLYRDIDHIGPYYHFCRFIEFYYNHSRCHRFDDRILARNLRKLADEHSPTSQIQTAQQIVHLLQTLSFTLPKHITDLTARATIEDAVTTTTEKTTTFTEHADSQPTLTTLCTGLIDHTDPSNRKKVLDLLLRALATSTADAIHTDRAYISTFGKVDSLIGWANNISPEDFSAHSVLMTASDRQTTVPADQVYSLMGILGVRFPVFPAEGVPKALARLLDEVVITSNDVSVFNWAGRHYGSPVQGRSLYPSNIKAFRQKPSKINRAVVQTIRDEHLQKSKVAGRVNEILAMAIRVVDGLDKTCQVLEPLKSLIEKVRIARFEKLQSYLKPLGELVSKIEAISTEEQKRREEEKQRTEEMKAEQKQKEKEAKEQEKQAKEAAEQAEKEKNPSTSGRFKLPSWNAKPTIDVPKLPSDLSGRIWGSHEKPTAAEQEETGPNIWTPLDTELTTLTHHLDQTSHPDNPPIFTIDDSQPPPSTHLPQHQHQHQHQEKKMTCPNPIAVSSAGIRGVFDIQRVIIKMQDPDALRANIANAISGQYIDGWCTISTGFAFTLVAFSCERDVLKQQLEIGEIVQQDILTDADAAESVRQTTPEQRKLARMVNFAQEPALHAIAGEWVLARFSSVEGARWFLCRLELGAGRDDFYARRISTDAFSFHNAIPERGLIEYWDRYMWNKKALACWVLDSFLDSKISNKSADEVWRRIEHREKERRAGGLVAGQGDGDGAGVGVKLEGDEDGDGDSSDVTPWEGAKMVGNFIMGVAYQQWAKHLESNIEKNAMDKIPIRLQGAILDLNQRKGLLPSMFHSGREVHMF